MGSHRTQTVSFESRPKPVDWLYSLRTALDHFDKHIQLNPKLQHSRQDWEKNSPIISPFIPRPHWPVNSGKSPKNTTESRSGKKMCTEAKAQITEEEGIQMIIALQKVVGVKETKKQTRAGWRAMSKLERQQTAMAHKTVCG